MFYITFESPLHKCQLKCLDNFLENKSYSNRHCENTTERIPFLLYSFWNNCAESVGYKGDITYGLSFKRIRPMFINAYYTPEDITV